MRFVSSRTAAFALAGCLLSSGALAADDKEKKAEAPKTEAPKKEPSTPAELLTSINELRPDFAKNNDRQKAIAEFFEKLTALCDKVVEHKAATGKEKDQARSRKVQILFQQSGMDPSKAKAFDEYAEKLKKEAPESAALGTVGAFGYIKKHLQTRSEKVEDAALSDALELAKKYPEEPLVGKIFINLSMMVEKADAEKAKKFLKDAAKAMPKNETVKGLLTAMSIMGSKMEINGPTLEGSEFAISSLKGKVVLVDFWATWCGPCVADLPNVVDVYKKHHKAGFEIVAVSLDQKREALEKFVKEKQIPWTQIIFSGEENMFWDNPLAKKYGIIGIPATFLLDRDGKVVAKDLHGEDIEPAVKKELDKKPGSPKAN